MYKCIVCYSDTEYSVETNGIRKGICRDHISSIHISSYTLYYLDYRLLRVECTILKGICDLCGMRRWLYYVENLYGDRLYVCSECKNLLVEYVSKHTKHYLHRVLRTIELVYP